MSTKSPKSPKSLKAAKSTKIVNQSTKRNNSPTVTVKSKTRSVSTKPVTGVFNKNPFLFAALAGLATVVLIAVVLGIGTLPGSSPVSILLNPAEMSVVAASSAPIQSGSDFTVNLCEESGAQFVNVVQADIHYPTDKLILTAVDSSANFPQEAATNTTKPGLIRIARSVAKANKAVKGSKIIATIKFKILPNVTEPIVFTIDKTSSMIVRSTDNKNILQLTRPASFQVAK